MLRIISLISDDKSIMTIVLDVSFDDSEHNNDDGRNEITRKKVKHNACSSKANKVAKVKHKVSNEFFTQKLSLKLQLC
jgi:hypothetical protein